MVIDPRIMELLKKHQLSFTVHPNGTYKLHHGSYYVLFSQDDGDLLDNHIIPGIQTIERMRYDDRRAQRGVDSVQRFGT